MLLESIFPTIPGTPAEIFFFISGILGVVLVVYSQFVEAEHRRDLIRLLGAGGLLAYSLFVWNIIFIILSAGIGIAALVEFVEIYLGYHKHTPHEIKEYIKKYKKKR
jgi:hypothetical protein